MSNSFYTHGSFPSTGSAATSATMRNELDLVTAGFDKLPTLASGSANQVVVLSATGLALTSTASLNGISIGGTTPAAGAFTTLSASSTVSGTGFSTYLASPPAIGGTAAAAITGTTITANTGFAGALNGTVGATTPSTGAFTTLSASSTVSGTGFSTYLASPPAIGGTAAAAITGTTITATTAFAGALNGTVGATTPATGAFTTLSASSTVSGTGFSTYLASPPAIGGTAAAAGTFTALTYSTTLTGGTGIVNLGSGQFYKDASGNVGIGITPSYKFQVYNNAAGIATFSQNNDGGTALGINNLVMRNANDGDNHVSQFAAQVQNTAGNTQQAFIAAQAVTGAGAYTPSMIFGQTTGASTYTERMRIDSAGKVGIGTTSPAVTFAVSATDAILVPNGTTAQRPTGAAGYIRYNSTTSSFEGYTSAWGSIGGGATGAGGDQIFYQNGQTVNNSYTITAGTNAGTFGPVSVAGGVTVTVPTGSVWSIV